jgi:hypothetical protein
MITLPGELSIKTIYGRNGPFNVGRLVVSLGMFTVKDAELDQFKEGKYEGDFVIKAIRQHPVPTEAGMFMQLRAHLSGMTLHGIDTLSDSEASTIGAQEPDPAEEEAKPVTASALMSSAPVDDDKPAPAEGAMAPVSQAARSHKAQAKQGSSEPPSPTTKPQSKQSSDEALFGTQWPLADVLKLDKTDSRMTLGKQVDRLGALGYEFDPLTQEWRLTAISE